MDQMVGESGPGIEFDQRRRDGQVGQHRRQLVAQRLDLGGHVLGGQPRDDQLPVVAEPHVADLAGRELCV